MDTVSDYLSDSKNFKDSCLAIDPDYFTSLSQTHQPDTLLITCVDSRIDPLSLMNAAPGKVLVHRNIANIVATDTATRATVQFATESLGVSSVIVMGHSHCGGIKCTLNNYEDCPTHIQQWVTPIQDIITQHQAYLETLPTEQHANMVALLNIQDQCQVISNFIQTEAHVHGWFFDIGTGGITVVPTLLNPDSRYNDLKAILHIR